MPLLTVRNLSIGFSQRNKNTRAVSDVSFDLDSNETLGIVGESGCGKSVLCQTLLRLLPSPPAIIESGNAFFDNIDLLNCSNAELRRIRGGRISMIFQDPMSSLNPYLTIGNQLVEALRSHKTIAKSAAVASCLDMLDRVGISDPAQRMRQYPHELSGGMRQRVMIAMGLITDPAILIADEPTTALDVTIQAQILQLLIDIKKRTGIATIFVTHNFAVIARICNRVMVMYAGRIMESGPIDTIFTSCLHPYTAALIRAIPGSANQSGKLYTIPGSPPTEQQTILTGCPFAPRCTFANDLCRSDQPLLSNISADHSTACRRIVNGEIAL